MKPAWLLVCVAVLALAAGIAARYWWGQARPGSIPNLQLADLQDHAHVVPLEWKGKVLVVNFWAPWCEPCREEMPEFARLQAEFGGRGLQFVGIALDEPDEVQAFLEQTPLNYPILIGDSAAAEWAEALGNPLAVLPFSVVFDREGRKVRIQAGSFRRAEILAATEPLLIPKTPRN